MKLNFALPPFQRISWASSALKLEWEPLLQQLPAAIQSVFAHPGVIELLPIVIRTIPASDVYLKKKQFEAQGIFADNITDLKRLDGNPFCFYLPDGHVCLVAGDRQQVVNLLYSEIPAFEILEQMGMPRGSVEFWNGFFQRGFTDPLWAYQFNNDALIPQHSTKNNLLNPYFTRLGISALPYYATSLECQISLELADQIKMIACQIMPQYLYDAWYEILSWPLEWSALHGIAEIKTPLFKLDYNTDAYGTKFSRQLASDTYPVNGLNGILFPYRLPKKMLVYDTVKFKNGIEYLEGVGKIG